MPASCQQAQGFTCTPAAAATCPRASPADALHSVCTVCSWQGCKEQGRQSLELALGQLVSVLCLASSARWWVCCCGGTTSDASSMPSLFLLHLPITCTHMPASHLRSVFRRVQTAVSLRESQCSSASDEHGSRHSPGAAAGAATVGGAQRGHSGAGGPRRGGPRPAAPRMLGPRPRLLQCFMGAIMTALETRAQAIGQHQGLRTDSSTRVRLCVSLH